MIHYKNQTRPLRWARTLRRLHSLWFCLLAVMLLVTNKSMAVIYQVGTGTASITTSGITPYTTYWHDNRIQYLYLASELTGLGASTGNITSVAFNFTSLGSPSPANVNIKMTLIPAGTTNINSLTLSGLTTVYSAATVTPTTGWNTYTLSTPYLWDGTSNILVEVCRDNSSYSSNYGVQCTNLGSGVSRTFGYYADYVAGCSMTSGTSASATDRQNRPNMRFDISPPPSCPAPTAPTGSATSATTANISWTAPGSPPSNGYQYAVTTSATPPGSGTPFAGTSTSVSGLTANTTYYLHVRSNCGGSGYSTWATSASFKTPCTDNSTFPYLQDFNGVTFAPSCWQNNQVSGTGLWQRSTSGSSPTVSPIGAAMAYFNSYSYSSGTQANLVSAPMSFPTDLYQVRFKMYRDNGFTSTADRVLVYYNTAPNLSGATLLGTINRSYSLSPVEAVANQWYEYTFNMPSGSAGSGRYVIFSAISAFGNNIFLDEVYIEAQPACLSPTAPTGSATSATTANISWTAPGIPPSNGYQYAVTTSATPPGSGTPFAGTSTSVSGLSGNTTYYLHVRSDCGGSGYSTWATSAAFTTPCADNSTFPYLQDFNGVTFAPSCWQNNQVSGTGLWQRSTSGINPSVTPIGAGMAYFNSYNYSSGTQANLVSAPMNFPNNNYQVRFKMYRDNGYTSNADRVLVYYNTAPNLSGATLLGTINRSYSLSPVEAVANQWYEYTFNMPSGSAGSGRYVIFSAISAFGNNIFLDEVYIEAPQACLLNPIAPSNGGSGCPSNGTVNLVWNTFAGATGYDVYFDGNNPPTTLVSANQSDTTYAATVASGVYYWMVVPQVPGGGSSCSVWSFSVSPAPTAVASSGGDVCDGFDISLYGDNTAPGQGSGNSYSWSGPNGFNSTIQNPTITGPNSSYTGYYTVVVTNQYGCTDVDSVQVTVNPNPTLNIINTQNVGCIGGSDGTATIGATGGTPDYDFTADFVNYYQGTAQATVPDLSEGTTTIYVSDVNGCSSTIDVTLTYDYAAPPSQPDPITGAPISVCPNPTDGPYTLSTSATDAASYHWYPGLNITGVNFLTADGSSTIDVEFGTTVNSTYVIRVEATNACGTSPYRAVMIRRTVSTPANITGNTIACANTNNVAYSCAAVTGADSYEWTITGDATVTGTTENATVNFGPAWTGGTLCVAAKVGCFTSSTKCMTISSSVSAAVIGPITGTFTACPNAVQTYSVANISGATYNWTTPSNSGVTQGAGTNSVEVTFQNNYNNIGNICVTVVSSCGVSTGPKCKTINPTVPKRPVSITGPSSGLCNGNVNYSVPPQAGMNFNWTTPGTIIGPNNTETINVQYGAFTTGQVCVSAYNACGTSPSRCMIVKGAPIAAASITPGLACANQNVTFTADTTNIQGDFALTWMYPNTATYVSGGGNTNDVTVTWGSAAGNVILLSSNACGSASKVQAVALDNCRLGEENSQASAFSVYPNPADNYITIEWNASEQGTTHIVLTDIAGKLVKENNIHNTTGINAVTMDVSMLPKGVYVLSAINNKGTINKRVVIE